MELSFSFSLEWILYMSRKLKIYGLGSPPLEMYSPHPYENRKGQKFSIIDVTFLKYQISEPPKII